MTRLPTPHTTSPVVLPFEEQWDWEAHRAAVLGDLQPAPGLESIYADMAVALLWRLKRVVRWETESLRRAQASIAHDYEEEQRILHLGRPHPPITADTESLRDDALYLRQQARALEMWKTLDHDTPLNDETVAMIMGPLELASGVKLTNGMLPGVPEDIGPDDAYAGWDGYTAGLLHTWAAFLADQAGCSAETLIERAIRATDQEDHEFSWRAEQVEEALTTMREARDALPRNAADLDRHEAHLSRELQTTLGFLKELQERRATRTAAAPIRTTPRPPRQ